MRTTHTLMARIAASSTLAITATACGGGFEESGGEDDELSSQEGTVELDALIASSGDAETNAVQSAVDAWEKETGNTVELRASSDITTDLSTTFASGNPADLMYIDAGRFATYADTGALYPYGDDFDRMSEVYQTLRQTFVYDDQVYCMPKDFSTLALIINTKMWKEAGLTKEDYPTSWEELKSVADQLTTSEHVGLAMDQSRDRVGAFLVQAGGWLINDEATEATSTSEANVEALRYVQDLLAADVAAWSSELDAGWGGEAFGTEKAAMTIEGNWINGAMSADYPKIEYAVAELPAGPAGKGTLLFTQCWGVAAGSDAQE